MSTVLEDLGLPSLPEPLPRPVIDSHTHADTTLEYSGLSLADNLATARAVGVQGFVQIGCDVQGSRWAEQIARTHPGVVAAVALHPNEAGRLGDQLDAHIDQIATLARAGRHVRAVGETGLDYYRTRDADAQALQKHSFARHLDIAAENDLTVVVHDRDAHADVLTVVDRVGVPNRLVMHCFSGDAAFARDCLDRGAWLSFPGVVTFGTAGELREALAVVPVEKLLVETDAPFLTPKPERGKKNAPYLLPHTIRFIAEQRGWDVGELCDHLVANTVEAFGGEWEANA